VSAFTAPIRRHETAKGQYYKDAVGARVPGVTTIIGDGVPKPALINWAANTTAEAAIDQWEQLAAMKPAARLKVLTGARYAEKDKAAKRGTEVHGFAERLAHGEQVQVPDELAGHVEAYAKFLDEFAVKAVFIEFSIASYRYGYAGTGDLIADITTGGVTRRLLCDIKTNKSGIFGETALQLAAYRYADVLLSADGTEQPMPEVDGCAAIHVRGDGADLIPVTADRDQHRAFLYAQQVAQWSATSRDLVGAPVSPPTTSTYRLTRESK
jgi:hypothetical protein